MNIFIQSRDGRRVRDYADNNNIILIQVKSSKSIKLKRTTTILTWYYRNKVYLLAVSLELNSFKKK